MGNDYVLDTYVFVHSMSKSDSDYDLDCVGLLWNIKEKNKVICIDIEGEILQEYKKHDFYKDRFTGEIWRIMEGTNRIKRIYGKLSNKNKENLIKRKFDSDDFKFLAVANRTPSKKLVSGDSDYDEENVHEYICKKMRIVLQKPIDALNEMK